MKKIILMLSIMTILFSSCQKEKCEERQKVLLKSEFENFQKAISNTNLTQRQIEEIARRHEEKQRQIMAECK